MGKTSVPPRRPTGCVNAPTHLVLACEGRRVMGHQLFDDNAAFDDDDTGDEELDHYDHFTRRNEMYRRYGRPAVEGA